MRSKGAALSAYSACGRPSRSEPRSGDKSERPDPGSSFTQSVDRRLGPSEGEQAEGDRSILRPRQWQRDVIGVAVRKVDTTAG